MPIKHPYINTGKKNIINFLYRPLSNKLIYHISRVISIFFNTYLKMLELELFFTILAFYYEMQHHQ